MQKNFKIHSKGYSNITIRWKRKKKKRSCKSFVRWKRFIKSSFKTFVSEKNFKILEKGKEWRISTVISVELFKVLRYRLGK